MQTQTIQKIQRGRFNWVSRHVRQHLFSGTKEQQKYTLWRTTRKNIGTFGSIGLPSLNNGIRSINEIKVAIQQGRSGHTINDFLKNSTLHEKLVRNLYAIIKNHPKFIDKTNWNKSTTIQEVLLWLIDQFNNLIGLEYEWRIVCDSDEENYRVVTYYEHDIDSSVYYSIPLSFLPLLKKRNKILHDIVVDMLALIKSKISIDCWYDEYGEWALEWIRDDFQNRIDDEDLKPEEKKHWKNTIEIYTEGVAVEYEGLLIENTATVKSLEKTVGKFEPKTQTEELFFLWIIDGISLLKEKGSIHDFCFNPSDPYMDEDNPLMPNRYIFYAWNFDDQYYNCYESCLQSTFNEYGTLPFISWELTKPESKTFNIPKQSSFPKMLTDFFSKGLDLINEFKKQYNAKDT